jgi:hypothetical protein
MVNLIYAIASISLFAIFLYSQITYVKQDMTISMDKSNRLEINFLDIKKGYDAYVTSQSVTPSSFSDFMPSYAFLPPPLSQLTSWTFGVGGLNDEGRYVCISGAMNDIELSSLLRLRSRMSSQAYFVDGQYCGVRSQGAIPSLNGAFKPVAATFWLKW